MPWLEGALIGPNRRSNVADSALPIGMAVDIPGVVVQCGALGRSPRRVVGEVTRLPSRRRRKCFDVDALATATDASSMAMLVCRCPISRSMEAVDAGAFVGQGFTVATG